MDDTESETATLQMLLEQRFGKLDSTCLNLLQRASPEQLRSWEANLLEAGSLEEVFTH